VDPVMGDNGKLYTGFTMAFAQKMASLCRKADVIVPNLTEATALLGLPYKDNYDEEYLKDIACRLSAFGVKQAVLTGVTLDDGTIGVVAYDRTTDTYFRYGTPRVSHIFHGTGDTFASALTGALTREMPLEEALKLAVDFTALSIEKTINDPTANWYGVNFELALPWLINKFN
ncbi:MAG: bifunctional hydroxymethylpyrimidine kinase/phosphomethylpyrimidine kinase, partial [Clostridia bacterium]|nr:bifunctional hydroxymethylpyrimidine kinase/phosphomethylpyrimidine kinase [Clostridia bacterium]